MKYVFILSKPVACYKAYLVILKQIFLFKSEVFNICTNIAGRYVSEIVESSVSSIIFESLW